MNTGYGWGGSSSPGHPPKQNVQVTEQQIRQYEGKFVIDYKQLESVPSTVNPVTDHGVVGDNSTDDSPSFAALSPGPYLVPKGTYYLATNCTLPDGVVLVFEKGAVLRVGAGTNVYGFEPVAGPWKILDIETSLDTNGVPRITGWVRGFTTVEGIMPEWFGAVGDHQYKGTAGTDCSLAWQKAVEVLELDENQCTQITFRGRHRFGSPVILYKGGFEIVGTGAGMTGPEGSYGSMGLYGSGAIRTLFDWGIGSAVTGGGPVTFRNLTAFGGNPNDPTNRAHRLLDISHTAVAPRAGLYVTNCVLDNFQTAVVDVSGGGTPVVANVVMERNQIHNGQYAFRVSNGTVAGFTFRDNYSSAGAKITCDTNGRMAGAIVIEGNLMEGQDHPVVIRLGLGHVLLGTNYWEYNGGNLFYVNASNSNSSVEMKTQFVSSNADDSDAWLYANGVRVVAPDVPSGKIRMDGVGPVRKSRIKGAMVLPPDVNVAPASLHPEAYLSNIGPRHGLAFAKYDTAADAKRSPWGFINTQLVTDNTGYETVSLSASTGEILVVGMPVYYTDDSPFYTPLLRLYNSDITVNLGDVTYNHAFLPDDGWILLTAAVRLQANTGASVRPIFYPYGSGTIGDGCHVGPISIYRMAAGGAGVFDPIIPWVWG